MSLVSLKLINLFIDLQSFDSKLVKLWPIYLLDRANFIHSRIAHLLYARSGETVTFCFDERREIQSILVEVIHITTAIADSSRVREREKKKVRNINGLTLNQVESSILYIELNSIIQP